MKKIISFFIISIMLMGCGAKPDEEKVSYYMDEVDYGNTKKIRSDLLQCFRDSLSDNGISKNKDCATLAEFSKQYCVKFKTAQKNNDYFSTMPLELGTKNIILDKINCDDKSQALILSSIRFITIKDTK